MEVGDEYSMRGLVLLWSRHISFGLRRRLVYAVSSVLVVAVAVEVRGAVVLGGSGAVVSEVAELGIVQFEAA